MSLISKAKIASKNRQRGKRIEKRIAKILGGKRVGLFGMEDIEMDKYSVECKLRKKFAGLAWLEQAERNNTSKNKASICTVQIPNMKDDNIIVMMRMKKFKELHSSRGTNTTLVPSNKLKKMQEKIKQLKEIIGLIETKDLSY